MKLELSNKIPDKAGYYYFCNFHEHTPTIVEVSEHDGGFFAQNEELCFVVSKCKDEVWCYIPNPTYKGKEIEPNSY